MNINNQLVVDAKSALSNFLEPGMYAKDFGGEEYERMTRILHANYEMSELADQRGALKQAITEFFAQSGQEITVAYHDGKVTILKTFDFPKRGESFDRVIFDLKMRLQKLRNAPETYKPAPFLWAIPEAERSAFEAMISPEAADAQEAMSLLRSTVDKAFELHPKDIVLFLRQRIYIRNFMPPTKIPDGVDKRFNGLSSEEMEQMFESYFPEGAWEAIADYLPDILEESLNFAVIDNATFIRTFIPIFRSMVEIVIVEVAKEIPKEKLEGFSGYVLRQHFDDILLYTAKNLLEFVESRDKNAESFIKYYADEVVVGADGKRLQKYAIMDKRGQVWNYSAILSLLMQIKQVKKRILIQEEKMGKTEERLQNVKAQLAEERSKIEPLEQKLDEVRAQLAYKKSELRDAEKEKKRDVEAIKRLLGIEATLLDEQKKVQNEIEFAQNRVHNKNTEVTNWEKQVQADAKQMAEIVKQSESIQEMYELIAHALAAVFAKR